jgi:thiol-disulfide isomerase/thioredoxin
MKTVITSATLAALLIFTGCSSGSKKEVKENEMVLGDVKLSSLAGEPIDMNEFKNKTVFINFWATWCKPCIQEMPTIASVQEKLKDKEVIFLLASNEENGRIEKFMQGHAYNFRYVQLKNMEELRIQALPTTFIFNPDGKLKFSETGFRIWDEPSNIELITTIMNKYEK